LPALFHYHLRELTDTGLREICIVVQPGEESMIRHYLAAPDAAYLRRLEKHPKLHREAAQMREFAQHISFAVQSTQEGYGHAVYQTRDFAAGDRVLLCLGDHLFSGRRISP
jgi:UTP--glucose-1-phosphate uridylyltransferase